jgi:hypothetical protein
LQRVLLVLNLKTVKASVVGLQEQLPRTRVKVLLIGFAVKLPSGIMVSDMALGVVDESDGLVGEQP